MNRLPRQFLDEVRIRATNALVEDYAAMGKVSLQVNEPADGADVHEDIRETLWPFFEEIRLHVQGRPDCSKRIAVGPTTAYACRLPEGHEGECQRV